MTNKMKTPPEREPDPAFTTIDDLTRQAQKLAAGMVELATRSHPLAVRRGVGKGVSGMAEKRDSTQIRAGSRTYFFDVEKTGEGKRYLRITESRFKGEGKDRERNSILVFPEEAKEFARTVDQTIKKITR